VRPCALVPPEPECPVDVVPDRVSKSLPVVAELERSESVLGSAPLRVPPGAGVTLELRSMSEPVDAGPEVDGVVGGGPGG
jgi:hypothetical protein